MRSFFLTAGTGWLGALAILLGALLPYLLRRTAISRATGLNLATAQPYLGRMWPHYWVGYSVAGMCSLHASLPMAMPRGRFAPEGLWLATVGLGLLWLQVWTGLLLRGAIDPKTRTALRRLHFVTMFAAVALIVAHIGINRG